MAFIVSNLAKYDFTRTDADAKGGAYQELVGVNLRGDRGQYFTPRGVVKLVVDIIATNPPFGSDIPITEKHILEQYQLARHWEADGEGGFRNTGVSKNSVAPEILFIERCIQWLKPGTGRMGIVLPDGVLGNPAAEYIRWWIMRETQVLASVDLPVEAFIAEANVNILTSLLFLRRKSDQEKKREALNGVEKFPTGSALPAAPSKRPALYRSKRKNCLKPCRDGKNSSTRMPRTG